PLMAEVASRWITSGAADALVTEKRRGAARRQRLLAGLLGGPELRGHPAAFHSWLTLPEAWRPEDFAAAARRRGVGVTPAAAFAGGPPRAAQRHPPLPRRSGERRRAAPRPRHPQGAHRGDAGALPLGGVTARPPRISRRGRCARG